MRFIAIDDSGAARKYLTPRRNVGRMYMDRSGWSDSIADAKIFQTRGAATNSAKRSGAVSFKIVPVEIMVSDD